MLWQVAADGSMRTNKPHTKRAVLTYNTKVLVGQTWYMYMLKCSASLLLLHTTHRRKPC